MAGGPTHFRVTVIVCRSATRQPVFTGRTMAAVVSRVFIHNRKQFFQNGSSLAGGWLVKTGARLVNTGARFVNTGARFVKTGARLVKTVGRRTGGRFVMVGGGRNGRFGAGCGCGVATGGRLMGGLGAGATELKLVAMV